MDNQLKERLVGATVLVVLAVIFIPMLLQGPGSKQRVQHDVELPPENSQKTVRIDLSGKPPADAAATEPASADTPASSLPKEPVEVDLTQSTDKPTADTDANPRQPITGPETAQDRTTTKPESDEPLVTPEKKRPDGAWTVQVGSFGQSSNADTLAEKLKSMGYEAFVSRYDDGKRMHYRVRVGGYDSRETAASKAEAIKSRTGEPARPAKND